MKWTLLLLALAGCATLPEAGPTCELVTVGQVPVRLAGGVPIVPMTVNGQPVQMMVDTGAQYSILSTETAERVGAAQIADKGATLVGGGGAFRTRAYALNTASIGRVTLDGSSILVGALDRAVSDGVLGRNALRVVEVDLDLPGGRMTLYQPRSCATMPPAWTTRYAQIPTQTNPRTGAVLVPIMVNGTRLDALLDTGASNTVLTRQAALRIGLSEAAIEAAPYARVVVPGAPAQAMRTLTLDTLQVGGEQMAGPRVIIIDDARSYDAILGTDYLARHRLWLSLATDQVYVAQP